MDPHLLNDALMLLALQGVMGAFDTIYHHELGVALPARRGAQTELRLHALRALLYGVLFAFMAWLRPHGIWVALPAVVIVVEIGLTLRDFVIEDRTRLLPASERVTHTLLAVNGGALFALYGLQLLAWSGQASGLTMASATPLVWVLTAMAVGVAASGIRDAFAAHRLSNLDAAFNPFIGQPFQRVLVTGGTGFIGEALVNALIEAGQAVTVLARSPRHAAMQFNGRARVVSRLEDLHVDEAFDVVVNLAGAPVVGPRWSAARKAVLLKSRVGTTEALGAWCARSRHAPALWVQASAIGYYGVRPHSERLTEQSPPDGSFMSTLCADWEAAAKSALPADTRQVVLRLGVVFGPGGALPQLLRPYYFGLGGRLGDGRQSFSWVHRDDVLAMIARAMHDPQMAGIYNATAPECPTQAEFACCASRVLRRPLLCTVPAAPVRLLLGEMAQLFFDGQHVVPTRLLESQFTYRFPTLESALRQEA
ncbi:MAG: TIGR01777 family oxidoreductase [Burkholderiales bacterium]|nr:TIGR01777 family oxidoreductase [Burkholderiales bacterium]